jgi:hypothetical protein
MQESINAQSSHCPAEEPGILAAIAGSIEKHRKIAILEFDRLPARL